MINQPAGSSNNRIRRIGAHVTTAGGLQTASSRAREIGANCLQIFSSPPQQWRSSRHTPEQCREFRKQTMDGDIRPLFIHGAYLVNLASDNPASLELAIASLTADLQFASQIGAAGVIFHPGSHPTGWIGKREQLVASFRRILAATPAETCLAIENSAGSGGSLGASLEELAAMRDAIGERRLRFCLDTAHAFAAGYNLADPQLSAAFVDRVSHTIGWESVMAIHLNDSKVACGARVDRHANIGEGQISLPGLRGLLLHPALFHIPLILETPGTDRNGPDKQNISRVKALLSADPDKKNGSSGGKNAI